jgi:Sulfotransferase family
MNRITVGALLEAARRKTGLEDFGPDRFLEPLAVLVDAYQCDRRLGTEALFIARRELTRLLSNRLRIQHETCGDAQPAHSPALDNAIVITGFPRSGTTFMHRLLSVDPRNRYLQLWEGLYPAAGEIDDPNADWRPVAAAHRIREFGQRARAFDGLHFLGASEPEECVLLFDNAFESPSFEVKNPMPAYWLWRRCHDPREAYAYYRQQLELLDGRRSAERWVLKGTNHLDALDLLVETMPNCKIVLLSRDPSETVLSFCNLVASVREGSRSEIELLEIGDYVLASWAYTLERVAVARSSSTVSERVVDVEYVDLVERPLTVIKRLYEIWALDLDGPVLQKMERFVSARRPRIQSAHRTNLGNFGLSAELVRSAVAACPRES